MSLRACKVGTTVGHRPFTCACEGRTMRGARQCDRPWGTVGGGGKREMAGGAVQTSGPGAARWAGNR